MTNLELIAAIRLFAEEAKLSPATVTSRAVGNSRLFDRLENGGSCTMTVAQRIVAYINNERKSRAEKAAGLENKGEAA